MLKAEEYKYTLEYFVERAGNEFTSEEVCNDLTEYVRQTNVNYALAWLLEHNILTKEEKRYQLDTSSDLVREILAAYSLAEKDK